MPDSYIIRAAIDAADSSGIFARDLFNCGVNLLIAKAVMGLYNGQDRRRLYEHGRNALLAELRALRPPLSDAVIAKERLAFEEAIRKVEADAAHRAQESD